MSAPREFTIYQNVNSRRAFDANGNELTSDFAPYISFKEKIKLNYQLITTDDISGAKYNDLPSNLLAYANIDCTSNNIWNLFNTGTISTNLSGAISAIPITYTSSVTPPSSGMITITNSSGEVDAVPFTARTGSGTSWTFTVSITLTYSYTTGDTAKSTKAYPVTTLSVDYTNSATGLLVFTMSANNTLYEDLVNGVSILRGGVLGISVTDTDDSSLPVFDAQVPWLLRGTVFYPGASITPAPGGSTFYTAAETDALLALREYKRSYALDVDGMTTQSNSIFTVASGFYYVITDILIHVLSTTGSGTAPGVKPTAGGDDLIPSALTLPVTGDDEVYQIRPAIAKAYSASDVVGVDITAATGYTAFNIKVIVNGYYYPVSST